MIMRKPMQILAASIAWVGMAGCAVQSTGGEYASDALRERTGIEAGDPAAEQFVMPSAVALDDGLTEDEAVALALTNNPEFKAQLASLDVSSADVVRARMIPNPSLSAVLGSSWEATLTFPFDFLWKRQGRIKEAEAIHASRVQQAIQSGLDLVLNVRLAHIGTALAERQLELAEAAAARATRVNRIAESRRVAGDASGLEVSTTTAEAAVATQDRMRARLQLDAARLVLRRLCRLDDAAWNGVLTTSAVPIAAAVDSDRLIRLARENRADVRAAGLDLEAAGARMGLARTEAFSFAAGAKATEGNDGSTVAPAFALTLPVFNRGQADVMAAQGRLQAAAQLYQARLDQTALDVRESAARLTTEAGSVQGWREAIVPELEDALARSERAYMAGDVPYLTVLDALRRVVEGRRALAEAEASVQRAAATLAHHVGGEAVAAGGNAR